MRKEHAKSSILDQEGGRRWIERHLLAARYLVPSDSGDSDLEAIEFDTVDALWQAVAKSNVPVLSDVRIHNARVSEWVPISPGRSSITRDSATLRNMKPISFEKTSADSLIAVYEPWQKAEFVRAGYGCIRFGPHRFGREGDEGWLLGATSTDLPHDGFPIAVNSEMYRDMIREIRANGSISGTLIGRLEWLPDRFVGGRSEYYDDDLTYDRPFVRYGDVPRVYLKVQGFDHKRWHSGGNLMATMATSFLGCVSDTPQFLVAFVSFNTAGTESLSRARNWLHNEYIRERYEGTIITDCDEQLPSADAGISLARVMSGGVDLSAIRMVADLTLQSRMTARGKQLSADPSPWELHSRLRFLQRALALSGYALGQVHGDLVIGDKYNVAQAAAVGPQAIAVGASMKQENLRTGIDLEALTTDLATLRHSISSRVKSAEDAASYGALADAELAAATGKAHAVEDALRRAGRWALEMATASGALLVAEAVERSLDDS